MASIQTVSYSFLVNGEVRGYVRPSRGIRQGDPLSPYLFILCAEGLSSLIEFFAQQQWIHSIKVTPTAPILHHLLFADDSFLFGSATEEEYILGVQRVDKHENYLGLPTHVGRSKTAALAYLKEKLTKKVVNWRAKLLSGAGKEILIKAVTQTVPMYVMNCYMLPLGLCDDMHQLCAGFWWGDSEEKTKIHWRSWERLCVSKKEGGMGFKNLHWFNKAMLAKQSWRLLQNPNSLLARLYKAIYFPNDEYLTAGLGDTPSFSWRSIVEARQVLVQGLRWQVGNGERIEIWNHNWIPDVYPRGPSSPPPYDAPRFVEELIDPITRSWDVNLLARNNQLWEHKRQHVSEAVLLTMAGNKKGGGAGVVIRDANGDFQVGAARPLPLVTSPFHAELMALKEGINLAVALQNE
ncbi:uncharacterized protein LOC133737557 [Rosa rugosa]|uniref:uncharacterized protein LOC133737557 n=1 Tax=Rosa rugosa TaxID=74645 RepID=UPI002B40484A|nr:uncharacterized protein LOC133737557 [Rosa rugosa]